MAASPKIWIQPYRGGVSGHFYIRDYYILPGCVLALSKDKIATVAGWAPDVSSAFRKLSQDEVQLIKEHGQIPGYNLVFGQGSVE